MPLQPPCLPLLLRSVLLQRASQCFHNPCIAAITEDAQGPSPPPNPPHPESLEAPERRYMRVLQVIEETGTLQIEVPYSGSST